MNSTLEVSSSSQVCSTCHDGTVGVGISMGGQPMDRYADSLDYRTPENHPVNVSYPRDRPDLIGIDRLDPESPIRPGRRYIRPRALPPSTGTPLTWRSKTTPHLVWCVLPFSDDVESDRVWTLEGFQEDLELLEVNIPHPWPAAFEKPYPGVHASATPCPIIRP